MRRIPMSFIAVTALLLAPAAAFAQNVTPLTPTDKIYVDRIDANGVGTAGVLPVGTLYNGPGIGYGVGAGGAVTQLTSRATAVTLNAFSGQITLFAAVGSATAGSFTVNNSKVVATDVIEMVAASGTNTYLVQVTAVAAGSFQVTFFTTGGTASDSPVFTFAVTHAATS